MPNSCNKFYPVPAAIFGKHNEECKNVEAVNRCIDIQIIVGAEQLRRARLSYQFRRGAYVIASKLKELLDVSGAMFLAEHILQTKVIPDDEAQVRGEWHKTHIENIHTLTVVGELGRGMVPALREGLEMFRNFIGAPVSSMDPNDQGFPLTLDDGIDPRIYDYVHVEECKTCSILKTWFSTVFAENYPVDYVYDYIRADVFEMLHE